MQQTARQAHPADLRLIIVNLTRQLERPTRRRNRRRDRPLPTSSPGSRSTCPEPLTRPRLTGQHRTPRTRIKPVIVGVHCRSRIYRTATQHVSVMIRISPVDQRPSLIWKQRPAVNGHQPTVSDCGGLSAAREKPPPTSRCMRRGHASHRQRPSGIRLDFDESLAAVTNRVIPAQRVAGTGEVTATP